MKERKGQEEIAGFVVLVVIVVVIGVIFLILSQKPNQSAGAESRDISAFLTSVMDYSSDCSIGYEGNYQILGELLIECWEKSNCVGGKTSCEILNSTMQGILDASWNVGPDSAISGYSFISYYSKNSTLDKGNEKEEIMSISKGSCNTPVIRSSSGFYAAPGTVSDRITYSLKVCSNMVE